MSSFPFHIQRVLILHKDQMQAAALAERMRAVVPTLMIVAVTLVRLVTEGVAVEPADLLVATDLSFPDGDVLDLIFGLAASRRLVRRFMVVTAEKALHPSSS